MRVECPCGELLKHVGDPSPQFADILPSQLDDEYFSAIENAISQHNSDSAIASQWIANDTAGFFRRMCQCPKCGRIFIEDEKYRVFEFIPVEKDIPTNLVARHESR